MTKFEYLKLLAQLYRQANLADSESAEEWQKSQDAFWHCKAFEQVAKSMTSPREYNEWLSSI